MWQDFTEQLRTGTARREVLRVVRDGVLADITHTASNDLHTGIRPRGTGDRRALVARPPARVVRLGWAHGAPIQLPSEEVARFRAWRERIRPGREPSPHSPVSGGGEVLLPWGGTLIVPELFAEPPRSDRYRALARAGIVGRLSIIGYDMIPVTIGETVTPGMSANFAEYLGVLKYVDRVSAISRSSAQEFRGFAAMLAEQGLEGPQVVGHLLPAQLPPAQPQALDRVRDELRLTGAPVVLVVGSHEPRKNHVTVLVAAERLWRSGLTFQLLFIGGSGWLGEGFHELAAELTRKQSRPITIVKRADEATLWAAYGLTRFSVFPSLAEGFGLPVAESLISGTPAITSAFGSMAEIAAGGGTVLVDPREPGQHRGRHS